MTTPVDPPGLDDMVIDVLIGNWSIENTTKFLSNLSKSKNENVKRLLDSTKILENIFDMINRMIDMLRNKTFGTILLLKNYTQGEKYSKDTHFIFELKRTDTKPKYPYSRPGIIDPFKGKEKIALNFIDMPQGHNFDTHYVEDYPFAQELKLGNYVSSFEDIDTIIKKMAYLIKIHIWNEPENKISIYTSQNTYPGNTPINDLIMNINLLPDSPNYKSYILYNDFTDIIDIIDIIQHRRTTTGGRRYLKTKPYRKGFSSHHHDQADIL